MGSSAEYRPSGPDCCRARRGSNADPAHRLDIGDERRVREPGHRMGMRAVCRRAAEGSPHRVRTRLQRLGLAAGCLAVLAACGSSSSHHTTAPVRPGTSGEAAKPAGQILSDTATALRSAHGYVMQGDLTQNGQAQQVRVVAGSGSLELAMSGASGALSVIVLRTGAYIRVNQAFLSSHPGDHGILANRWIQIPATSAQTLAAQLGQFSPAVAARCLIEGHGTLSVAGRTTVTGHPAVVIRDAGNVPGGAPGTLAVAVSGPPYPLQIIETGNKRAGGRVDVCNNGQAESTRGQFTFSRFGSPPPITAPSNPLRIGQQGGSV